jgi:cyclopropane fatty-acyl-phospholipid synthase-like methyltransferase
MTTHSKQTSDFDVPDDWHETFFDGPINRFWEAITPPEATQAEAAFVLRRLDLAPGAHVLDAPCGAGRHARAFARAGYQVTGLDSSRDAIARAVTMAGAKNLDLRFEVADMRDFRLEAPVDGVACLGNSVGYFQPGQTDAFFGRVAVTLRPGGRLVLDTGAMAESLFPIARERRIAFDGGTYEAELAYDPMCSVLKTRGRLLLGEEIHAFRYAHHVMTTGELVRRLDAVGLETVSLHGDVDDGPYALGSPRLLLTAVRR